MSLKNSKDWKNDPEYIELMNFLIEKTRNAKTPLNITPLAREFKEKSGSSLKMSGLFARISRLPSKLHQIDTIDTETTVKMMFALSAPIDEDFLNELQKDADVEVDWNNRIIKYIANDGSLELEGDQSQSAKILESWKQKKRDSQGDSGGVFQDFMPKTPGSVKRATMEIPDSSKRAKDSSPVRYIKIEDYDPDDSSRVTESKASELSNSGIQQILQPKVEEAPIKTEPEADDVYVFRMKFLKTIHSLVLNLDTPSLSPLQAKIDEKLREYSPDAKISKDEMSLAMELLVAKLTSHSMSNLPENAESVRFSHFLCYLKTAILNSKLEGLKGLLEKIRGRIKEPASKDKSIPVETVASDLQSILDVIGF